MNDTATTKDITSSELVKEIELEKNISSALDKAFLWLIRTGIVAIICLTTSAIVHNIYLASVIAHLA